jgi:hypothetical protein
MMETKDLMWAVWCLVCAFGAFKIGGRFGFMEGRDLAPHIVKKLIEAGYLAVVKQDQRTDLNNKTQHN